MRAYGCKPSEHTMLNEARASFMHPLALVETSEEPGVLLFNAFALAEDLVVAALSHEHPEENWRVVKILHETGLPVIHIQELFNEIRLGNRQALLRLIEYVADALVDEADELSGDQQQTETC
jgi:hypothetical protein